MQTEVHYIKVSILGTTKPENTIEKPIPVTMIPKAFPLICEGIIWAIYIMIETLEMAAKNPLKV